MLHWRLKTCFKLCGPGKEDVVDVEWVDVVGDFVYVHLEDWRGWAGVNVVLVCRLVLVNVNVQATFKTSKTEVLQMPSAIEAK